MLAQILTIYAILYYLCNIYRFTYLCNIYDKLAVIIHFICLICKMSRYLNIFLPRFGVQQLINHLGLTKYNFLSLSLLFRSAAQEKHRFLFIYFCMCSRLRATHKLNQQRFTTEPLAQHQQKEQKISRGWKGFWNTLRILKQGALSEASAVDIL